MLKLPYIKALSYIIALVLIATISCDYKKPKSYSNSIFKENKEIEIDSKINFRNVAKLNEANQKVIDIATIAFNKSEELNKSRVILKIKKDHQKIESELKKITSENLIIIPEPIFDLKLNQNFLNGLNSNYYLISLLEKEINNQIILLDSMKGTSRDEEFKKFADKSKDILVNNNELLEKILEF